jgi:hypothetical protein
MSTVLRGSSILPALIVAAGFFLTYIFIFTLSPKPEVREHNAYIRGVACILSIDTAQRGQHEIEQCWEVVEAETGIKVHRYDKDFNVKTPKTSTAAR